eukprot:TRINITY_DN6277_c0_g1_i1.p1 TRINITY_DN6277_c0_g1~~TRINITY_DN6277_c0_g1_i1.p1  ORF type:complete len:1049 (+),score=219.24 TRINITY_DN6277_c0_g1_i1:42-3149(+)
MEASEENIRVQNREGLVGFTSFTLFCKRLISSPPFVTHFANTKTPKQQQHTMEASEENIKAVVQILTQTLSPDLGVRRGAEEYLLTKAQPQPGFSLLILKMLTLSGIEPTIKVAAAILFKNFVKRNWVVVEGKDQVVVSDSDRQQIKGVLVELMLNVEPAIMKQLSEALALISASDFPAKWNTLLPSLVTKFSTPDFRVINGVLETVNTIFRKYRHEYKSEPVIQELKYILDIISAPLLQLAQATSQLIDQSAAAPKTLEVLFQSLNLIFDIFYSLCAVDLPEFFEDHMKEWMNEFLKFLNYESKLEELISDDENEAGLLHKVQARVCDNINLFIGKYEEEFEAYLRTFMQAVWQLVVKTNHEAKYDEVVSSAIGFLKSVAQSVEYKLYSDPGTMRSIVEQIVIRNMEFRESDEEIFEDNGLEYIRRDIEGSDNDTRRRAACELIKALRIHFNPQITELCSAYISTLLQHYAQDPKKNWKAKDSAIFLVTALTVTTSTQAKGVTSTNDRVNVVDFFTKNILPELQGQMSQSLVLKADCLKFTNMFRSQIPFEMYPAVMQLAIAHLDSPQYVVHSYAAIAIERLLTVKVRHPSQGNLVTVFNAAELKPYLQSLLTNLFKVLQMNESKENDYVMKALMRVVSNAAEELAPITEAVITQLNAILGRVYKNPTNPTFNHYLFETISALIRGATTANSANIEILERHLFPAFQAILSEDITEFAPYVFQLLSFLLELRPDVPESYMALFGHLLAPTLWQRTGNVPALNRLVQAFVRKAGPRLAESGQLEPILGVFQKLIASQVTDHEGFFLLESVVESMSTPMLQKYLSNIFTLIFSRLQVCKTMKFIRSFIVFLCLFISKHGATVVVQLVDSIQPRLFHMVLESLLLPNLQKVTGHIERKLCCIAISTLLGDCPAMLSEPYYALWGKLLQAVVTVIEEPEDDTVPADMADNYVETEDVASGSGSGYSNAFSLLVYATKSDVDPFKEVDPKRFLVTMLKKLSAQHPGKFGMIVQQSLTPQSAAALQRYFIESGIPEPYLS